MLVSSDMTIIIVDCVCTDFQAACRESQGSSDSGRGSQSSVLQERRGLCVCVCAAVCNVLKVTCQVELQWLSSKHHGPAVQRPLTLAAVSCSIRPELLHCVGESLSVEMDLPMQLSNEATPCCNNVWS